MTAPHPIVARYELGEPERQGPLGLVKRRQLEDIPKTKPHEVLVWRVGNRYVVDRQERRAHDDILVRASSVSVVSVRPGTEVQVEFRIDTQDAAEFVVRVTFSCSVVDPVTVVRNGQVNVADALLEYLHAYPDLSQLGLKYSVADVNKIRTAMAAHIRAYMAHYPPRIPGIEIGTATVHVETPVALGKIQKINEEQLTPSHTRHKSPESPVRRNGARRVRRAGRAFAQSSRELKDPRHELRGLQALWAVLVLGFAGAGGVVLLGGGLQELAGDGRVLDGGGVVDPEHGGEVQGVGAAGEGFLELPVDAEPFEGGGQAAA